MPGPLPYRPSASSQDLVHRIWSPLDYASDASIITASNIFQSFKTIVQYCSILFMDILHSYSQDPYIYMTCPARGHTRMLPQSGFSASYTIMKHSEMPTNCIQSHAEAMGPEGLLAWPEIQDPTDKDLEKHTQLLSSINVCLMWDCSTVISSVL